MILIALYLLAIVIANITVALFGAEISILNAFLFIGLDLTARDKLHEQWSQDHLWRNMLLLIASGSILSAILNINALPMAIASFAAFACSGIADTIVYQVLGDKTQMLKINGSNVVSAGIDSLVFPILAFGFPPLWGIVLGQWVAKIVGGFIWSWVLFSVVPKFTYQS